MWLLLTKKKTTGTRLNSFSTGNFYRSVRSIRECELPWNADGMILLLDMAKYWSSFSIIALWSINLPWDDKKSAPWLWKTGTLVVSKNNGQQKSLCTLSVMIVQTDWVNSQVGISDIEKELTERSWSTLCNVYFFILASSFMRETLTTDNCYRFQRIHRKYTDKNWMSSSQMLNYLLQIIDSYGKWISFNFR